jgi:leader peptidase (prepilin peptidase)/N-methyltransferase
MNFETIMIIFSILLGLAWGSFLNVCIFRIPLKRSIISPPSGCPHCHERIRFYDNIPVLSFILLRGKCRYCRNRISWHYPVVEALTALLSLFLFIKYNMSYQYIIFLLFLSALVVITFIDLYHRIIPDVISLPGIIAGFIVAFILSHISWYDSIIGALAGGGSLFLIAVIYERLTGKEGMGFGDVKLLAMIGAWMGWRALPFIVLISSLSGAVVGVIFLSVSGKGLRFKIPFGPFLSFGTITYLFFGLELEKWYFGLFQ